MHKFPIVSLLLLTLGSSGFSAEDPGRFNLKDKPAGPRFDLPEDRVWPEEPGQPVVCLWQEDKFAAVSITIDDNWAPDHAWWMAITQELDFRVTWFVITERVKSGGLWGTWEGWRELAAAGHSIQSHSASHLNLKNGDWQGIDWEYKASKETLEQELPDHRILVLAYPGGGNSKLNDREVAATYYIAGRGTVGTPNKANRIDYLSTNSAKISRAYVDAILEGSSPVSWLGGGQYKRAWLSAHFHGVKEGEFREETEKDLRYLKEREADLWVAPFEEVARYGQQRDTHELKVLEHSPEQMRFLLTDKMQDDIYDLPLTVKLKLPADWTTLSARQGENALKAEIVEHNGNRYALLPVVPDRGDVVLAP